MLQLQVLCRKQITFLSAVIHRDAFVKEICLEESAKRAMSRATTLAPLALFSRQRSSAVAGDSAGSAGVFFQTKLIRKRSAMHRPHLE